MNTKIQKKKTSNNRTIESILPDSVSFKLLDEEFSHRGGVNGLIKSLGTIVKSCELHPIEDRELQLLYSLCSWFIKNKYNSDSWDLFYSLYGSRLTVRSVNQIEHLELRHFILALNSAILECNLSYSDRDKIEYLETISQLRDFLIKEEFGDKTYNLVEPLLATYSI